ncbi:MAG: HAD-IA family hydrolase [Acholeplasmataceae bacterium]|jgi:phosphoglycolate phosphatase|nr:HAD-IA family hydrolase [Acholeplasmataceae bacterium]
MIKAILFDMDGTILDTLTDIWIAVNHAFNIKGFREQSLDKVRQSVGNGAMTLIKRVVPNHLSDEEIKEVFDIYQHYYDQHHTKHTGPYPGVMSLLYTLKDRGYKLGVVSNKFEHLVEALNHDIFNGIFDISIGETKGVPIKPAPDMLYRALDILKVAKNEVVFVGDSDTDIITAQNADILSVGVTWGFRDKDVLIDHGAKYIINNPSELISLLEKGFHDELN